MGVPFKLAELADDDHETIGVVSGLVDLALWLLAREPDGGADSLAEAGLAASQSAREASDG